MNYLIECFLNNGLILKENILFHSGLIDITSLDFLWGYVKGRVYQTPVSDRSILKDRMQLAIFPVAPQLLKNTWREIEYKLVILPSINGIHLHLH